MVSRFLPLHHEAQSSKKPGRVFASHQLTSPQYVMSLLLFLSVTSILRLNSILDPWIHRRLYRPETDTTAKSPIQRFSPRMVYLDGTAVPQRRDNYTHSYAFKDRYHEDDQEQEQDGNATRSYPIVDSKDTSSTHMEQRHWPQHESDPHCKPVSDWQTSFHPVCNDIHSQELLGNIIDQRLKLLSAKGYWRLAWKYNNDQEKTTTVWKTFK
jgi:hypothetical protein